MLKVYCGSYRPYPHELEQLKEVIRKLNDSISDQEISLIVFMELSNGDMDCILITAYGIVILDFKDFQGEIIGTEEGDWFARQLDGNDIPLQHNLYHQLKHQRNDLSDKIDPVRERNFPRIDKTDFRKIGAWGYFNKGSYYSDYQMNLNKIRWFDIVTEDTLAEKISRLRSGYTFKPQDIENIVSELHVRECPEFVASAVQKKKAQKKPVPVKSDRPSDTTIKKDVKKAEQTPDTNESVVNAEETTTNVSEKGTAMDAGNKNMDIIRIIGKMASSNGVAPDDDDGCSLFGIGNDDAISRLRNTYLQKGFSYGDSAEKYVSGPTGSGKSHFINQFCDVARNSGCITSRIKLAKKTVDVSSFYQMHRAVANAIRVPGSTHTGIKHLMTVSLQKKESEYSQNESTKNEAAQFFKYWIDGLENPEDSVNEEFWRVVHKGCLAWSKHDDNTFSYACRWLGGEFDNKDISKALGVEKKSKQFLNTTGLNVNLSLYQLIKKFGYPGTVVVFDEADQGFEGSPKYKKELYSVLQSTINALNDLKQGSVLFMYAVTPDIIESMMDMPQLLGRVSDPFPDKGFDIYTTAPIIRLSRKDKTDDAIIKELGAIGNKLVDLFYSAAADQITTPKEEMQNFVLKTAKETIVNDKSESNRRKMVNIVCKELIRLISEEPTSPAPHEDEV